MQFTVAQIQDMAKHLHDAVSAVGINDAADRVGVDRGGDYATKKEWRVRNVLRAVNGTNAGPRFLAALVSTVSVTESNSQILERAFRTTNFHPIVGDNEYRLVILPESGMEETGDGPLLVISQLATPECQTHVTESLSKLTTGDDDGAVAEMRLALDKLVTLGNFKDAVDELVQKGVIASGSAINPNFKNDAQMLKTLHDYLGTLGHHTGAARPPPNKPQTRYAVASALESLRFLVLSIHTARAAGTTLAKWA